MVCRRCENCGEVRWDVFGLYDAPPSCPACGADMSLERRNPGRDRRRGLVQTLDDRRAEMDRRSAAVTEIAPAA